MNKNAVEIVIPGNTDTWISCPLHWASNFNTHREKFLPAPGIEPATLTCALYVGHLLPQPGYGVRDELDIAGGRLLGSLRQCGARGACLHTSIVSAIW